MLLSSGQENRDAKPTLDRVIPHALPLSAAEDMDFFCFRYMYRTSALPVQVAYTNSPSYM